MGRPLVDVECAGCGRFLRRFADDAGPHRCVVCSGISKSRGGLSPVGDGGDQEIFDAQQHETDHMPGGRWS
jgi:hypothetical protein